MIVIKPILALSLVAFALASPLIQPRQGGNGNEVGMSCSNQRPYINT
jgi:hypothetical protein